MKRPIIYVSWLLVLTGLLVMPGDVSPWAALRLHLHSDPPAPQVASPPILPAPAPDPRHAPQPEIDKALYSDEEFFGSQTFIERPTQQARENLTRLIQTHPQDAHLRLMAAKLDVRLGQFDRADEQMRRYIELEHRQPRALKTLAVFYDSRARFADEIGTLMELARRSPQEHRSAIYQRVIALMRDHQPPALDLDHLYREMIEAHPDDFQIVQSYIEDLLAHRQMEKALAAINQFRSRYPKNSYLLQTEANIDLSQHRVDAALAVYEQAFEPLWPPELTNDYLTLLKRVGRYRVYRRQLRQRYESGAAEFRAIAQLFDLYVSEGNTAEATRVLTGYEKKKAAGGPAREPSSMWPPTEIETLGAMYASIGNYDQASRYYYTLHLMGVFNSDAALREEALHRLFQALMQAQDRPTRVAAGDLSLYKDIATVDQNPGLLNGALSLILANANIPYQFQQREAQATQLFNALLAYRIFEAFKSDYPESKHLPEMYLGMIGTFDGFKRYQLAVDLGQQFLARYPNSPRFEQVSLKIADAYRALKDSPHERLIYQTLLDRLAAQRPEGEPLVPTAAPPWTFSPSPQWAAPLGRQQQEPIFYQSDEQPWMLSYGSFQPFVATQEVTYKLVLDRFIASLRTDGQPEAVLQLYWNEIRKHPQEEGLYETFLQWLDRTGLFNEKLRAYQDAIRNFPSPAWHHRLARWLIRQQRREAFQQYSREIVEALDDEEIRGYLQQFITSSNTPGDQVNYDAQLYFQLYQFAHNRFPHNVFFVHGLLEYYRRMGHWAEWERLATQYYFADPKIRDSLLPEWSKARTLRSRYQQARQVVATSLAYRWFAADAAIWLTRYEEAVEAYTHLLDLYPGDPAHAERLATLLRSLGQKDEQNFARSAIVWSHLAVIYPTDHDYHTKAGEASADAGDLRAAGQHWDEMLALESGRRETYLEVAGIYWDYFMYDDAARVIKSLRDIRHDQTLYAYQLGAIHEGQHDDQNAVREYVKALAEPGMRQQTVARHLAHLAQRRDLKDPIQQAYAQYANAHPDEWHLPIGYEQYLAELGQQDEAWRFLETEVDQRNQEGFLLYARNRFHEARRLQAEERALSRLIAVASTEPDDMKYRLQLASYDESQGEADKAAQIVDALVSKYPTNYGVLDEATHFFWRVGLLDRSIDLYKTIVARARGGYVRAFKLELARRLGEARRFDEAETVLRGLYAEDPTDTGVFGQLAHVLSAAGKSDALLELYRTGIANIRKAPLPREAQRDRIADLRRAMIDLNTKLGNYTEAIDQHIEIINRDADNRATVNAAMDDATRYNLADRLIAYYQKTANESFRDYHWNQVLAWIYEYRGEPQKAAEQYTLAVRNEPQRLDLRLASVEVLMRLDRYDEAITQLQRGYELSGEAPDWQVRIAQAYARQGNHQGALDALNKALTSNRINSQNIFQYASMLESWGLSREARQFYLAGFERVMKDFYTEPLIDNSQLDGLVRTSLRTGVVQETLNRLLDARRWAQSETKREGNYQVDRAQQFHAQMETTLRDSFAQNLARFGQPAEVAQVVQTLKARAAPLTGYSDAARAELSLLASLAHTARLADLEEQALRQLVDSAFRVRMNAQDTRGYQELQNLLHFYDSRGAFVQAANTLVQYHDRNQYRGWFNYQEQLAQRYRWAGDAEKELAALRQIYQIGSGELTDAQSLLAERYFTLLYQKGLQEEFARLARTYSPHQLQLVNFLIARGEQPLAQAALEHTQMPAAWINSRHAQVGYYFGSTAAGIAEDFRSSLRVQPIGRLIAAKPDPHQVLIGDDWYRTARVYGLWLELTPATQPQADNYIVALTEDHPRQSSDQLDLANHYLGEKKLQPALTHAALAEELAPQDFQVKATLGEIQWAQGNQQEAVATWDRMISENQSNASAHVAYLDVLAQHDVKQHALAPIQTFMIRSIKESGFDPLRPLVRRVVEVFDVQTAASLFEAVLADTPSDVSLATMVIEEKLLPSQQLTPFYRTMVAYFGEGHVAQSPARARWHRYQDQDQSQASPVESWEQRLIHHLIEQNQVAAAQSEIAAFKKTLDPAAPSPDWLVLDEARIELRLGQREHALQRLRQFAPAGSSLSAAPQKERFLQAAALLKAEGLQRESNEFLLDMYSQLLTSGQMDNANFVGLADALFNLGRPQEALAALQRMVNRASDPYEALPLAGEVAFGYRQFGEAVKYRSRLEKINPEATENRIELARAQAASGDARAAVATIASVLMDRKTSSELAAQATELLPELAGENRQQALAQLPADSGRITLARVALLRQMGQVDQAGQLLQPSLKDRYNVLAQLERALLEQHRSPAQEEITAWQEALFIDPEEVIAHRLIFATNTPRAQLIRLYSPAKRSQAALRIAEGLPDFAPAAESDAEEQASVPSSTQSEAANDEHQFKTMPQRNAEARTRQRIDALDHLAQAAKELGDYQRAMEYLRRRLALLKDEPALAATKQAIAALKSEKEQADRQARQTMSITKNEVHLGIAHRSSPRG
jgi:tetratricopeptide (TPR) repeat protein